MAPTGRIRVICKACEWAGRREAAGGPCYRCGKPTTVAPTRAPSSPEGHRQRLVVHVLPSTRRKISASRAAVLLDEHAAELPEPDDHESGT